MGGIMLVLHPAARAATIFPGFSNPLSFVVPDFAGSLGPVADGNTFGGIFLVAPSFIVAEAKLYRRTIQKGRNGPASIKIFALFDFDKSTLTPAAGKTLQDAADAIAAEANLKHLRVRGHTDSKGTEAYNDRLSQARAATVQEWLAKHLAKPVAMSTEAGGEREPVKPNANADGSDNPEGRAFNRRVDLVLELCN
jgi:outer membrane protein OmpA-like peptidoglycan-associated protein